METLDQLGLGWVSVVVPGEPGYVGRELPRAELVGTVLTAPLVEELQFGRVPAARGCLTSSARGSSRPDKFN